MNHQTEFPLNDLSLLLDQISTTAFVAGSSDAAEEDLRKMLFVIMKLADEGKGVCDSLLESGGELLLRQSRPEAADAAH